MTEKTPHEQARAEMADLVKDALLYGVGAVLVSQPWVPLEPPMGKRLTFDIHRPSPLDSYWFVEELFERADDKIERIDRKKPVYTPARPPTLTADECNEFLRSLPPLPLAGDE